MPPIAAGQTNSSTLRSPASTRISSSAAPTRTRNTARMSAGAHATTKTISTEAVSDRHHWPRNTIPSRYSQEVAYLSDTTGPIHVSLRGSRPVLFPRTGANVAVAPTHGSDPNTRDVGPHVFHHAPLSPAKEWIGDRQEVMKSVTKASYTRMDANETKQVPIAGNGGQIASAAVASKAWLPTPADVSTSPTPLQALAAARGADLLAAAQALQRKAAAEQAAADRLFEASAKARYESAARAQSAAVASHAHRASNTSAFFLDPAAAAQAAALASANHQQMRDKIRGVNASAAGGTGGSQAGLSSRRRRDWSSDTTLRLVRPAGDARAHDSFDRTFDRVMSGDAHSGLAGARSTTSAALDAGLHSDRASGGAGFVPHFLRGVHPSLHSNVRRAAFQNGNDLFDPITTSSKFSRHKFQPRAYNTDATATAANASESKTDVAATSAVDAGV